MAKKMTRAEITRLYKAPADLVTIADEFAAVIRKEVDAPDGAPYEATRMGWRLADILRDHYGASFNRTAWLIRAGLLYPPEP